MPTIKDVKARWILDSRAKPTVEVELSSDSTTVRVAAPSGASTGKKEAKELRDGGKAFHGYGVSIAISNVEKFLKPILIREDPTNQEALDKAMIEVDGTPDKHVIGGNAMIATSMAIAKLGAAERGIELFEHIHDIFYDGTRLSMPITMFNVINGGEHAGNELAVQEFLIVPQLKTFKARYQAAAEIYFSLRELIRQTHGKDAINVGDEGGFALPLKRTEEALVLLEDAIDEAGYTGKVKLSLDAAANSFYDGKTKLYNIDGKKLSREELVDHYVELNKSFHFLSLEDPFAETDPEGFAMLKKKRFTVIGDDLTVTNVKRLRRFKDDISGLIIKPNQIGTLTETFATLSYAQEHTPFIIVSHRSGETEYPFIAHFAVGVGAPYAKFGAPARSERTAKYNELLRIEEILGS